MIRRRIAALVAILAAGATSGTAYGTSTSAAESTFGGATASVAAVDPQRPAPEGAPWSATDATALQADLDALLAHAPTLHGAHAGVVVEDTGGHVLDARNADDAFQPASTFKLLVGSVALDRLGPGYRFATELLRLPPDGSGQETLVLRGGDDPLFGAADLEAAAAAAQAAGVSGTVRLILDESRMAPGERFAPGWSVDDREMLSPDAPVLDGLPFAHNSLAVTMNPGPAIGAPVSVALPAPLVAQPLAGCRPGPTALTFAIRAHTVAADVPESADTAAGRCGEVVAFGDVRLGIPAEVDTAVDQPEVLAWQTFSAALARHGMTVAPPVAGTTPIPGVTADGFTPNPAGTVIWRHDGEPLTKLLADMWFPSDNFIAEELLREMDVVANQRPGTAAGAAALERAWLRGIGIDPATLTIADGSGLSQYNRVTPRALAAILLHDWTGPNRDVVLDALPIAGVRGTQRGQMRGTPAEGRVYAKDGAMKHIRGLAGYVATRTHGTLIFALSVDDWMGNDADLNALRAAFCSRLARS
jgi:D-alanyl-D-alanine carboxypeptidase/D-alanyl-D-alanine-endopeptidase (penicillin-binding protein 4)